MSTWGWNGPGRAPDSEEARAAVKGLVADLFIVPAQIPRSVVREPEKRLALAVIGRAIDDLRGVGGANVRASIHAAHDARRWIASDSLEPYSFAVLCHAVGIDADALRRKLLAIPTPVSPINPALWTPDELATLREMYPDHTAPEIARRLNRTTTAVVCQASKLGLHKQTHGVAA